MGKREKTETKIPWSPKEWEYCLTCFQESQNIEDAINRFNKDYNRSSKTITQKFKKEGIYVKDVLGSIYDYYIEDYIEESTEETQRDLEGSITRREILRAKKFYSLTNILCEQISKHLKRLPTNNKIKDITQAEQQKYNIEIVVPISDAHIGAKVKVELMGGMGQFDIAIFQARLDTWKKEVISYIENYTKSSSVGKVHFQFMGDNIDGDDIYPGHGFNIDTDVFKQIFIGADLFSTAISEIAHYFPKMLFECEHLGGNHGRDGGKKGYKPYRVNWDLLLGHFISHRLSNHKNIISTIPDVWFSLKKIFEWNFLFLHGDNVSGDGPKGSQTDYMLMLNRIIHYLAMGHQHSDKSNATGYLRQFVNGDWVGGSSYSKVIKKVSRPMQLIMAVDEKYGVNNLHSIYFDTYEEYMKRTDKYLLGD